MADDVVIGSASVQIVGDYSGLEKSFNESTNLAQAAGQKISAAFEASAAGANSLTAAVSTVASTVEDLATKSGLAGGELNLFRAALQGSLEAGIPVNDALRDMSASSTTLGTAVAGAAQALQQETQAAAGAVGANEQVSDSFKRVRNDAEALEKAWEQAIAEEKKMADAAKKDAAAFQQAWSDAIKENNARAQAEFEKFAQGVGNFISHPLQTAGKAVTDFMLALGPMGVAALGAAAAVAAIGKGLFDLVVEFGAAAEATSNMADRLNISWQEMRNLEEMAQIAGVSVSGLQAASFRLADALEGTSAQGQKVAEALGKIGVAGETSGELLTGFLQKLSEIPDDTKRIALAHEVLGRSSQQIIPLIKDYANLQEAVRGLGGELSTEMVAKIKASDDALDKLSIAWKNFKQGIAVFAAPGVEWFLSLLQHIITGVNPTLDQQIAEIERKMVSMGEKSALAGWLMADGMTKGKNATLEALKAQRELLVGQEQAIERSRQYNAEIAKSNAEAKAASGGGLAQSIIDKQKELTAAVTASQAAFKLLNQSYQTGKPLASGYVATSADVARALAAVNAAQAAASLTTAAHGKEVEKFSKALKPAADNVSIFVKQLELMKSAHQKLISDAAEFSNTFGKAYDVAAVAAIKAAAAAFDLKRALEALGDENVSFLGNANKVAPLMDDIAKSITEAKQAALDTDPYAKLAKALEELGIKSLAYYQKEAEEAEKNYQIVLDSGVATYEELAQAALVSVQKQIQLQMELGEITREEGDKTLTQIQDDLDALDMSSEKSTKARGRHEKTLGEEIQQINRKTFDALERGLAKSIVEIKGFADLWKTLWQGLSEDLLQIMLKVLFKPLEDEFAKLASKIPNLLGMGGGGGGGKTPGVPSVPSVPGTNAVAQSAGLATASAITGMITGAVQAVSAVIGNFQMAGMNKSLDLIENYTRYLKIGLVEQGDSLLNDMHIVRNVLTDFSKWNQDVVQTYYQGFAEKLDTLIGMGGIHSSGMMASVSNFSTSPAAKAEMATPTVNINIDTVESDVTDAKVTATMNRAFRMSKLAGALPPGRFPQ